MIGCLDEHYPPMEYLFIILYMSSCPLGGPGSGYLGVNGVLRLRAN